MAGTKYAERNPFPDQATASVDLKEPQNGSAAANVRTPQLKAVEEIMDVYTNSRSDPAVEKGGVLALYGPPGSGKTHTLRYLMARNAAQCVEPNLCGRSYVLCGTSALTELQYSIVKNIDLATLQAVSRRFVAMIGRTQIDAQELVTETGKVERAKLHDNLPQIGDLIRSALIDPDEVSRQQNEELRKAGNEDFKNALSYLDDDTLGPRAYAWLCGEPVSQQERAQLGIRAETHPPGHARDALVVVLRLFHRAGTPLVVFLDQCEKFLQSKSGGPLLSESTIFLQWLTEKMPAERALLGTGINEEVWQLLPDYLRQRFGFNAKKFSALSVDQAKRFIHTYVKLAAPADDEAPQFYPFDEGAIREILASARGNLRRFLETSHQAFKLAEPDRPVITAAVVRTALERAHQPRPSLESVLAATKALLVEHGLTFSEAQAGSTRTSLTVRTAIGQPVALVQLSHAMFYDDEARQGLASVDAALGLVAAGAPLMTVIVVAGYASPEVLDALEKGITHVLVYDPENFTAKFTSILVRIPRSVPAAVDSGAAELKRELAALREDMRRLAETRTAEATRTVGEAGVVAESEERKRIREFWRGARGEWAKERKNIEEQIKEARSQRLKEELAMLELERKRAWRERSEKLGLLFVALALTGDGWLFMGQKIQYPNATMPEILLHIYPIFMLLFALAAVAYGVYIYIAPTPGRALWTPVASLDELDQLTNRLTGASEQSLRGLSRNPNPQLRYAAVRNLTNDKTKDAYVPEAESNITVRRAWAWYLRRRRSEPGFDLPWPEMVYAREGTGSFEIYQAVSRETIRLLAGRHREGDSSPLNEAYAKGFNEQLWSSIARNFSVSQIRTAVRELSPLDRPGLGTFDYLRNLPEIDSEYLFFRQLLFYVDLDPPTISYE